MLKEKRGQFLKSLYEAEEDMISNIKYSVEKLHEYQEKISQIRSAIANLEADNTQ